MQRSVKDHQAEAYEIYEIYEIAQEFSKSKDARTDLEGIVGKDATIHSMSKIIVNMTVMVQMQNAMPAVVKQAHAVREAAPDKSMK